MPQGTGNMPASKNHKLGATRALNDTLQAMIDAGEIVQLDKKTATEWFKTSSQVYALGDHWNV